MVWWELAKLSLAREPDQRTHIWLYGVGFGALEIHGMSGWLVLPPVGSRSCSFYSPRSRAWPQQSLGNQTRATPVRRVGRSPVNQVFQFMTAGSSIYSAQMGNAAVQPSAYLWIPEQCARLRGLVIFCWNVTEHCLVGDPALREACAANDLGVFWGVPSFFNQKIQDSNKTVAILQQLLDQLAETSGYEEVSTIPWLPVGESFHQRMVRILLEEVAATLHGGNLREECVLFAQEPRDACADQ